MNETEKLRHEPGTERRPKDAPKMPPAGPHAREDLTNHDATPGAGALPSAPTKDGEVDPGSG
jgi:hypothetical protein